MRTPNRFRKATRYLWREWIKPFAIIAAIVFPLKSAIADWNWVPSGSMKPTILEGDLVLVNKLAYDFKVPFTLLRVAAWNDPANDDIVVFFSPHDGKRLVKRIIACSGDTIEMRESVLWVNGRQLEHELPASHPFSGEIYEDAQAVIAREHRKDNSHWVMALPSRSALRDFSVMTVPEGQYFVMGDSRDNSFDSRFFGFVDRKQIVGRTSRVLLSFNKNAYYVPRVSRWFDRLDAR